MIVRDASSRRNPLPPGSLSSASLREARSDDRFYLRQHRLLGPIFKLFWGSGDLKICVVGFARGRRLLNQHRGELRLVNTTDITSLVPDEYLRSMDPAIHPRYRRLFRNALHADLVAQDETSYRRIVRDALNVLAENSPTDLSPPRRFYAALDRIANDALLLVLWGVAPDSRAAASLREAFGRLGPDGRVAHVGPPQIAAFADLRRLLGEIVDGGAGEHSMLGRMRAAEPAAARDETAMGNAIYMVERGRHDLRDLLRWIVKYLSDDPSIIAELRAPNADPDLAQACVLETLRLDQAELLGRKALSTFTFDGFRFPRGSWVSILIRESHRDPSVFDDPDVFRPKRFLGRRYSTDHYAPFGIDEHQCLGASLVVRLSAIFVLELTRGFDWKVIADGARRHGELHWEPSPAFAIELRPRA